MNEKRIEPDFWNDPEGAQQVERALAAEKSWVDAWDRISSKADDIRTLAELAEETAQIAFIGENIKD